MEEATYLTKFATKVTLIHRRDGFRASKAMLDRAHRNEKIIFRTNAVVTEVLDSPAKKVSGIRVKDVRTGAEEVLPVEGLFIAIGHDPNTAAFRGQLEMGDDGYIAVQPGTTKTAIPGVFAAGDVADRTYRQAVTAAGTGCMAALDAERYFSGGH